MFAFDPDKSAANLAKHGIDFEQAQALWDDAQRVVLATYSGADGELRRLVVGLIGNRLWSAVIAERDDALRIISVRRSRDKERQIYHEQDD